MLASEIIQEARDFHEEFSRTRIGDKALLRTLSRAERSLFRDALQAGADAAVEEVEVVAAESAVAAFTFGSALDIPAFIAINQILGVRSDDGCLFEVYTADERASGLPIGALMAEVIGGSVYLRPRGVAGGIGNVLKNLDQLQVRYIPDSEPLSTLEDELNARDSARDYLVGSLVSFMAMRISLPESPQLVALAKAAKDSVIATYINQTPAAWHVGVGVR